MPIGPTLHYSYWKLTPSSREGPIRLVTLFRRVKPQDLFTAMVVTCNQQAFVTFFFFTLPYQVNGFCLSTSNCKTRRGRTMTGTLCTAASAANWYGKGRRGWKNEEMVSNQDWILGLRCIAPFFSGIVTAQYSLDLLLLFYTAFFFICSDSGAL